MADIEHGTQFSDLPSSLVIDILLRLPVKTLLICRYIRKDWMRLYFSDPYFIGRQLETSNIQFLNKYLTRERKFRFGCFIDEVSTGNLRMKTVDFSCKLRRPYRVINSCNGLVCLTELDSRNVYVCNPILGEWVSTTVLNRKGFFSSDCALGFSCKNNQYKILSHALEYPREKWEWQIYTLGTGHWRSVYTTENIEPWGSRRLNFNTFIHGSLHWTSKVYGEFVVNAFNFETERFTELSLPDIESSYLEDVHVTLGVINDCLWASFHTDDFLRDDGEMWAMKEYGDEESWTMMLAFRNNDRRYICVEYDTADEVLLRARHKELVIYKEDICHHDLLFSLNGEEMLTRQRQGTMTSELSVVCYNITRNRRRELSRGARYDLQYIGSVAYNPSFVSLHDVGRGEEFI